VVESACSMVAVGLTVGTGVWVGVGLEATGFLGSGNVQAKADSKRTIRGRDFIGTEI
jgi:hypothetical protein